MPPSLTGYRKPTNPLVSAVLAAAVIVGAWREGPGAGLAPFRYA
jgi:hypothetical protein